MNAQPAFVRRAASSLTRNFAALSAAVLVSATIPATAADVPRQSSGEFQGMYKIASSNDPIFPVEANREWFLDFGQGISAGKLSGNVAVSLRQNPNVKVRILVWQYFPKQGNLVMGNPYSEGSKNAVVKGAWQLNPTGEGVVFVRGNYRIVMNRAAPGDY